MGNTYRIIVKNQAAKFQRFPLFNEAPEAATRSTKQVAFTNVWATAPGVPGPHGRTDFTINVQEWAVTGISPQQLNPKVVVETSDAAPVDLNVGNTSATQVHMIVREGGAGFDPNKVQSSSVKAGFSIETGSFDGPDNPLVYVGLGRQNPKSADEDIVPVAVWSAGPNETYEVIPKEIFYIATGDFKVGEIVNVRTIGKVAKVDFTSGTGAGKDTAIVEFSRTHEFNPAKFTISDRDGDLTMVKHEHRTSNEGISKKNED